MYKFNDLFPSASVFKEKYNPTSLNMELPYWDAIYKLLQERFYFRYFKWANENEIIVLSIPYLKQTYEIYERKIQVTSLSNDDLLAEMQKRNTYGLPGDEIFIPNDEMKKYRVVAEDASNAQNRIDGFKKIIETNFYDLFFKPYSKCFLT